MQSKQRRRRKKHHMPRSTTLPSLQPLGNQRSSTHRLSSTQTDEPGSHIKSVVLIRPPRTWRGQVRSKSSEENGKRVPHPQEQRTNGEQQTNGKQQTWKFVNRYAHRSNGGIPIFSEERLQERARKVHSHSIAHDHIHE